MDSLSSGNKFSSEFVGSWNSWSVPGDRGAAGDEHEGFPLRASKCSPSTKRVRSVRQEELCKVASVSVSAGSLSCPGRKDEVISSSRKRSEVEESKSLEGSSKNGTDSWGSEGAVSSKSDCDLRYTVLPGSNSNEAAERKSCNEVSFY